MFKTPPHSSKSPPIRPPPAPTIPKPVKATASQPSVSASSKRPSRVLTSQSQSTKPDPPPLSKADPPLSQTFTIPSSQIPSTSPVSLTPLEEPFVAPQANVLLEPSSVDSMDPVEALRLYQLAFIHISASAKEIVTKITEGKSVTSANKKRIQELANGITAAIESANEQSPPELPKPVSDTILCAIRDTIREEIKVAMPSSTSFFSEVAPQKSFAATLAAPPPPKKAPTRSLPAIIVRPKENAGTDADQPNTYEEWRKNVTFRDTTFAPSSVKPLRHNTLKIEFDTIEQRDETLKKVSKVSTIVAEEAKLRSPLIILKGVSKEVLREELLPTIAQQNEVPVEELRLCFLLKNRNQHMYNAVLEVAPAIRRKLVDAGRVNVEHQRVHVADFSRFVQCYKCLQFGHTNSKCTADFYPCAHCGSTAHHISNCSLKNDPSKRRCYNCCKNPSNSGAASSAHLNHSATDANSCPKIIKAKQSLENNTNYGH